MIWESGSTALQVWHLSLIRRFERIESGTLHVKSASWMGRPQVLIVLTGKLPMFPKLVGGRSAIFHAPRSVLVRFARFYAESHLWRGGDGKDRPCRGGRKASMSLESVHHVFSLSFPEGILLPWNGTLVKLSVISKVGRVMSSPTYFFKVRC